MRLMSDNAVLIIREDLFNENGNYNATSNVSDSHNACEYLRLCESVDNKMTLTLL